MDQPNIKFIYVTHVDEASGEQKMFRYVTLAETEEELLAAIRKATQYHKLVFVREIEVFEVEPRKFDMNPEVKERK
jgi:nucleoside-triphosphatase THEP1